MKEALIKQPIGLGDIFYLQKVAVFLMNQGYEVIWPVRDDIFWIADYILNGIKFYPLFQDFPHKEEYWCSQFKAEKGDFLFLSPDGFQLPGKRIMESKNILAGLSDDDWYDYFDFVRMPEKEDVLYHDILGLEDSSKYIFFNKMASIDVRTTEMFWII